MTTKTGTCPACFRTMALDSSGMLARHGWSEQGQRRAGEYGRAWHVGACFGVGRRPFEVSPEGTVAFVTQVVWPDALAAANELGRLEARPMLVFSITRSRAWNQTSGRYEAQAPLLVEVPAGATDRYVDGGYHVPSYADLHARRVREASSWSADARRHGADLSARVASWTPAPVGERATRGPIVHFAMRRGTYCDLRNSAGVKSSDRAAVTCSRCLRALASADADRAAREGVLADAEALRDWLRAQPGPATRAEIKSALGWDTKRLNRALDRATLPGAVDGGLLIPALVRTVNRYPKPEAFAAA